METKAEVIVNPVNCVGVMGKGFALQFKEKYPDNFKAYKEYCDERLLNPGEIFFHRENGLMCQWIANAATKNDWRHDSKINDIKLIVDNLVTFCIYEDIRSVIIPKIGCGLGGLDYIVVKKIIIDYFNNNKIYFNDITVYLYN